MTTEHTENEGLDRLTRSLDLLWGRRERERPARGPKPSLTLTTIVETAIALADRDGLAALSMRSLATELGVGTMSLYRYVPSKSELIDLMVDHVNGPGEEPEDSGGDWRGALERIAEGSWRLYTSHPWLIQINQARPILGPNSMAGFEFALKTFEGTGLTGQEQVRALVAMDNLVLGAARSHILYQQTAQQSGVSDEEFWKTQEPYMAQAMESGVFPRIAALPDDSFEGDALASLRFAVTALLDGFARLIAERTGGGDARTHPGAAPS